MKFLVPIIGVPDPECTPKLTGDGQRIDTGTAKVLLNPFCEIALTKALDLKDQNGSGEVVIVTVGPAERVDQLRSGLALGADRAIHVVTNDPLDARIIATVLKTQVETELPDVVLGGKQAVDGDRNEVLQRLAALLDWPQACNASTVSFEGSSVAVACEVDDGLQTVVCNLPVVITADLRLVQKTRFASLPNIMKARKKPVTALTLAQVGINIEPGLQVVRFELMPERAGVQILPDVASLVTILQKRGLL